MSITEWITISSMAMTVFIALIGSVWHLSKLISSNVSGLNSMNTRVTALDQRIDKLADTIQKLYDVTYQMHIEMTEMQVKLDVLWRHYMANSDSPISLNNVGLEILAKSNIGAFAEKFYSEIISKVRSFKPENAYQAQEILISILSRYKKNDDCRLQLQEISFSSGYDIKVTTTSSGVVDKG